jgi:hypothetical protein
MLEARISVLVEELGWIIPMVAQPKMGDLIICVYPHGLNEK